MFSVRGKSADIRGYPDPVFQARHRIPADSVLVGNPSLGAFLDARHRPVHSANHPRIRVRIPARGVRVKSLSTIPKNYVQCLSWDFHGAAAELACLGCRREHRFQVVD